MAATLWRFWLVRGYYSEGRAHLAAALALPEADEPQHAAWRAKALTGASTLAWRQNDYGPAQQWGEESLALYRTLGDQPGIAQALHTLGNLAQRRGDYPAAR